MSNLDLTQVLHLANSNKLQAKIGATTGRVASLLKSSQSDREIIDELYLATLTRLPTADERDTATKYLSAVPARREALEDLLWALLNCPEFIMNH